MKDETPFNPIVIPDLNLSSGEPPAAPAEPTPARRKTKPRPVLPRTSRNVALRRALTVPASEPRPAQTEVELPRRKASSRRSARTTWTRRALDPKRSALRFARKVTRKAKVSWKRVKAGITARLAHLDQARLKKVLIGCGVAAAVATAIVVVAKLTPLIVAMLALLGLGAVLQMWGRLCTLHPACTPWITVAGLPMPSWRCWASTCWSN